MDIRTPNTANSGTSNTSKNERAKAATFKTGVIKQASAKLMIPPVMQAKLSHISKVYGLPVDLGAVSIDQVTPENTKALRKIVDMVSNNSKLLPEWMKLVSQLLKSDIKMAEFHKNLTKAAIKHQESIDQETAEIFLAMAKHGAKSNKLEHRMNTRANLIDKRDAAYERHYDESVFGNESRIIDVEYQVAASNSKILAESKTQKINFNADRKKKATEYVNAAFTD